jgi:hypothetical protein
MAVSMWSSRSGPWKASIVRRLSSGTRYFAMDIVQVVDEQTQNFNWISCGFVELLEAARLRFGIEIKYCDEPEGLIRHEKRKKAHETHGGMTEN